MGEKRSAHKVIFLDRDGTINVDHGFVNTLNQWEWCSGAIEGLQLLQRAEFLLAVVSNQSGIGHGLYTKEDALKVNSFMLRELKKYDVELSYIAFCPHRRDADCLCRKPNIGLAREIEQHLGVIDYPHSWIIGDKLTDMKFGHRLGMHTALIRSKYWRDDDLVQSPDLIVESLLKASQKIVLF